MRGRLPIAMALPATAILLALTASPALAVTSADTAADPGTTNSTTTAPTYPTTSTPVPDPGSPPNSVPNNPSPLGHAVGDAATGLAVVRLLPGSVTTQTDQGADTQVPKQSAAEAGFGLSDAEANSESYLNYQRAIAQSCPAGVAIAGDAPQLPGCLSQTALPDNAQPLNGGLDLPSTPLDALLKVGTLDGTVHARWSDTLGPCVGTIADASTSLANISAVNVLPSLPDTLNAASLASAMSTSSLTADQKQALVNQLSQMSGPLANLAGLLGSGTGGTSGSGTGTGSGSLVSLPDTLSDRSVVQLVNIPGSANKAVQSISTMRVASVQLLAGTAMEIDLNVVSQPTLTVTSTGNPATSTVNYTAPVIQLVQGGKTLFTLDAAHPTQDIPIGIPLNVPNLPNLPVVGNLLPNGQPLTSAIPVVDIGVLRLSVAELSQTDASYTGGVNGAPFTGYQLGATARLLDLQVLPTQALGIPNLPAALAQVSLGEQVASAYAPTGGVQCASTTSVVTGNAPPAAAAPPKALAWTDAAYEAVPMFWIATGLILVGTILIAALPTYPTQRRLRPQHAGNALASALPAAFTPTPTPRPGTEPTSTPMPSTSPTSETSTSSAPESTSAPAPETSSGSPSESSVEPPADASTEPTGPTDSTTPPTATEE